MCRKSWTLLALVFACFFVSSQSFAFCRTTTCDPDVTCAEDSKRCCILDSQNCDINGTPISWPTSCVSFNVHDAGSRKRDISAGTLSEILDTAFDQWLGSNCNGDTVELAVDNRGTAECNSVEYNPEAKGRNANIWMFRDSGSISGDTKPRPGDSVLDASALGVSTVSFSEKKAQIYDVDVELNSAVADFTTTDELDDVIVDLASVVTHEAGHFLGLDHSFTNGAVMSPGHTPGTIQRTLSDDERAGICSIYPPGRAFPGGKTCDPRGKYSEKCQGQGCGCRAAGDKGGGPSGALLLSALALALFARRRSLGGSAPVDGR